MSLEERNEPKNGEAGLGEEPGAGEAGEREVEEEKDWRAEAKKFFDLYARSQAEMENLKKRVERDKADYVRFSNESLVRELLPVLDNMERAIGHACENGEQSGGLIQGIRMTHEGLVFALDKFGVKPIKAVGEPFDPNFHEAVMQREDPDVDNFTVLDEIQKGYLMNDRLIRPSMVVVSKKPIDETDAG